MYAIALMILALLFAPPAPPQAGFPATCEELATIYGATLEPVDYSLPHGWDWVIEDMAFVTKIWLGNGATLEQWREKKAGRLWLFHFYDHEATFDENGEHYGLHHMCVFTIPFDAVGGD